MQPQAHGQQPCQGRDEGTVSPVRFRAGDLATQDCDLMPQDRDFCVLSGIVPGQQRQPSTRTMSRYMRRMSMSAERRSGGLWGARSLPGL